MIPNTFIKGLNDKKCHLKQNDTSIVNQKCHSFKILSLKCMKYTIVDDGIYEWVKTPSETKKMVSNDTLHHMEQNDMFHIVILLKMTKIEGILFRTQIPINGNLCSCIPVCAVHTNVCLRNSCSTTTTRDE